MNYKPFSTQYKFGNKILVNIKVRRHKQGHGRGVRVRIGELDGGNVEGRGSQAIKVEKSNFFFDMQDDLDHNQFIIN